MAAAIVGTAGTQLLTPALFPTFDEAAPLGVLLALAFVPAACYLVTTGAVLAGLAPPWKSSQANDDLSVSQAHALFSFLGLSLFALLAALAFLQTRDARWLATLPAIALPLIIASVVLDYGVIRLFGLF